MVRKIRVELATEQLMVKLRKLMERREYLARRTRGRKEELRYGTPERQKEREKELVYRGQAEGLKLAIDAVEEHRWPN